MNICAINGSPKPAPYSVTYQTVLYLQKRYPRHHYETIDVGAKIRSLEKDPSPALEALARADVILFSYPVYTFLAPSQLHRFLRLVKERGADLSGKYASQITTSKHFYDVTAHRYVEENCFDLGLRVVHGLSADMEDLTTPKGQRDADAFFEHLMWSVENRVSEPVPAPWPRELPPYQPVFETAGEKEPGHDTVIVADLETDDHALAVMIEDFQRGYPYKTRLINIAEFPFQGGCLGCFHCAGDGKCVYKDGFDTFLRQEIQTASAIVYAFSIKDHSMGPCFKTYDDRQFCNGHRTVTEGMPFGYLVNGCYPAEENLRMVIEARAQVGGNFLAGVGYTGYTVAAMARQLAYAVETHYDPPRNFYGVGGMKIFRDLIWVMRGLMKADHDYYKAHGVYDFPQKQRGKMLAMCALGSLVRNPKIRSKMGNKMNEGMVAPYKKVIDGALPAEK